MAVYPNSIFPWTNRVDNVNIVFAADPNELAAEIQAIEKVLGTAPNVEPAIGLGTPNVTGPTTYATVRDRITAASQNQNMPYAILHGPTPHQMAANTSRMEGFVTDIDQYAMYNGTDLTMPYNGLIYLETNMQWDSLGAKPSGIVGQQLFLNNASLGTTELGTAWRRFDYTNPDVVYRTRGFKVWTQKNWMGAVHKNDRITVKLHNLTTTKIQLDYSTLRVVVLRQITQPFPALSG